MKLLGGSERIYSLFCLLLLLLLVACVLAGCGTGGYAGGSVTGLSRADATIDAGQSIPVTAQVSAGLTLQWSLSGPDCSGTGCGTISSSSGATVTYTAPAGLTAPIQVSLIASVVGTSNQKAVAITVNPDPVINGNPPSATVGVAYSTTITATGGTPPLKLTQSAGTLPAGLSFNPANGVISGTPTTQQQSTAVFQVVDSSDVPYTVTAQEAIDVSAPTGNGALTIAGDPPSGTVGASYTATLQATGGMQPYSWTIVSGSLPTGLTLGASTGVISGTPTAQGTFGFSVQVTDANNLHASAAFTIAIDAGGQPLKLTTGTLPNGIVGTPYSATIGVSGGTSPYSCAITSGTLPAGLTLGASCLVSGTPTTAGQVTVQVKATDSSSPQQSTNGPESITITTAALTLTTGTLPNGTVGTPYSATIGVSGGTSPYSCTITSGSLPAGLTLGASCLVSGTPTTAGQVTVQVKATDSSNPQESTSGPETITINPAALSLTTGTLPNGTVGTPYSATIGVSGGTSPYSCTITSGSLPAGLTLGASCLVSGTPTTAETVTVQVKATDSSNPQETASGPETITITAATATLTISSPPPAVVNQPYSGTIPVSGGTAPYSCLLVSGTLPAGLTLASDCVISGTPTTAGTVTVTVKGTDSSQPSNTVTGPVTVTVTAATPILTISSPPDPVVGAPYQGTIPVTGGTPPYTCVLKSGSLPAGLTLGANCVLTGTPTTPGTVTPIITATDSGNPPATTSGPVPITVLPPATLTLNGSLPNATLGVFYTQTLHAEGGVPPYTYSLTAGALPPGITLSTGGVISGTPTAVGASSFTVTATDSETTPQTASLPLVLLVVYPVTPTDGLLNGPYAFLFQGYDDVVSGVLAYQTATVGSFTADGTGAIPTGELDANHQTTTSANTTVTTQGLLGTYTIGADDRGSLTITTLNADGTVDATTTYAISVHAAIAPATTSASGSLIEYDGDQLTGTRGSGSFLAQTASAFTAGVSGSYAFGLSGDTPCLPACTAGLLAGPVASVGAFSASAEGNISGTGDANIATDHIASSSLTGSVGIADSDGRVQLNMITSGTTSDSFPQDYAVYVVDANRAFILSTDLHSGYILLAGSAQKQQIATFTGAALSGDYVGYENSPTNPGLVGATLQNVLNLSTATIFRGTANGAGSCDITNVDTGGTTALVNGLTGLGSGVPVLNALLGTYESTGTSTCAVAADGRVVFNYPAPNTVLTTTLTLLGLPTTPPAPRIVYLSNQDQGYFLETGYAGLGNIEQQTGSPFTLATLDGTYVYGTAPAASLASANASGVFTANGAGKATTTLDENVGAGNINVLELGVSGTENYILTDAAAGRFLLGTSTVVYAINPDRFVLLDTSALATSPSVALIY